MFERDDDILTVFDRFEVVEIEASGGNALGIEVDVRDDDPALCGLSDRLHGQRGRPVHEAAAVREDHQGKFGGWSGTFRTAT
jgi:hypothetical protein